MYYKIIKLGIGHTRYYSQHTKNCAIIKSGIESHTKGFWVEYHTIAVPGSFAKQPGLSVNSKRVNEIAQSQLQHGFGNIKKG